MSRITFTSLHGDADLCGRERAHASCVVDDMFVGLLDERHLALVPPGHYLHEAPDRSRMDWFRTWWRVDDTPLMIPRDASGGRAVTPWDVVLNTAIVNGSDPVRWLARLHATCEIHGYVEGEHRGWLADVIDEGLDAGVLRTNELREWGRWNDVTALLRSRDDEPVVMHYSVTDWFPDPRQLGLIDETTEEADLTAWDTLDTETQWAKAMDWLRLRNLAYKVDLDPGTFRTQLFGAGWTIHDLNQWLDTQAVGCF